jgi:outer membrane protein OmpA-like peptidoglycan-associated protein
MRSTVFVAVALASTACASLNRREQGAAIGATGGAVVGGVIENNTGSTARGAIIGAVVGGTTGMIIGHQMDLQARALTLEIPGAIVQRLGEGIQVTFASGLLYGSGSDTVRPEGAQSLQSLALSMKKYPDTELLIVGHTDGLGTSEHNMDLSSRRASSASRYLSTRGLGSNRIHTAGKGGSEPLEPNDTESGRAKNRRIEVAIFALETARNGHPITAGGSR